MCYSFVWFDSLHPINNLSVIKGRVFLGWTSTMPGFIFLLKDTTQWCQWGSNPGPLGLESSTLPLSHCALSCVILRIRKNIDIFTDSARIIHAHCHVQIFTTSSGDFYTALRSCLQQRTHKWNSEYNFIMFRNFWCLSLSLLAATFVICW